MVLPAFVPVSAILALALGFLADRGAAQVQSAGATRPAAAATPAALPVPVVFMEPGGFQLYREVSDPARLKTYHEWLQNESALRALALYARAVALAPAAKVAREPAAERTSTTREHASTAAERTSTAAERAEAPGRAATAAEHAGAAATGGRPYYIALLPEGNYADAGFRLETAAGIEEHPQTPYIKLDPDPEAFATTLLHETGHMILAALNGDDGIPRRQLAAIPHTTAALSDRGTAFDEGFAIHLETLAAHLARAPELRARYHHESLRFGVNHPKQRSEYARHAADLLSYSQTIARYREVLENCYAFAPACREADYLRVQLDPARDFARLREANQLLQSEGFYASFFFALTFRGEGLPDEATLRARQERMLTALRETLAAARGHADSQAAARTDDEDEEAGADAETPWLLRFVENYVRLNPDEAAEVVDMLMDLSHGVFVDAEAPQLWREFYEAALRLDLAGLPKDKIKAAREHWREAVLKDSQILYSRVGPQLPCKVAAVKVQLVALKRESPLAFDLNTVEEGVLKLVPGITPEEVARWLAERGRAPFKSSADFKARVALSAAVMEQLRL